MGFAVARSSLAKSPRAPRFICSSTTSIRPSAVSRVDPPATSAAAHLTTLRTKPARVYPTRTSSYPRCRGGIARPAFARRATASVRVAPGVHQHPLQKQSRGAELFFTNPCEMLPEMWSGGRDAAPLDGIAQSMRFFSTRSRRRGARTQRFLASRDAHG